MENNVLFFKNQIQLDCGDYCICLNIDSNWGTLSYKSFKELMSEVEKSPADKSSKLEFLRIINDHLLEIKCHFATLFDKSKSKYSWKRLNITFDMLNLCGYTYAKIERG